MRLIGRAAIGFVFLLAVSAAGASLYFRRSLPQTAGTVPVPGLAGAVEVVRDGWGIPHIFAATDRDAFLALGYVHAQDRLWQMEWQRRIGAGRLSEVVGLPALPSDKFLRTLGVRRAAEALAAELSPEARDAMDAYAAGVNAFLAEGRPLPPEFVILGVTPEPWTVPDSLVWMKMMSWNLAGNYDVELLRTRLIQAVGTDGADDLMPGAPDADDVVPGAAARRGGITGRDEGAAPGDPARAAEEAARLAVDVLSPGRVDALLALTRDLDRRVGARGPDIGSNAWVVSGAHTVTGEPILANDPHLGTQIPSQWYLAELNGDTLHVVGATLPGLPLVVIGRTARVAWGLTNLGADVQDLYVERVDPADRNRVAAGGGWTPMTVVDDPIRVKDRAEPVVWTARRTTHGPVLTDVLEDAPAPAVAEGADHVLALRWTALEPGDTTVDAFLALNHAASADDVLAAARRIVSPCQNIVFADVDGRIGSIAPCRIPVRAAGDDGRLPIPGWDGAHEWQGDIPFDELPRTVDPPAGFVVAANQQAVPDDYPFLITHDWAQPYRARRITTWLQDTIDAGTPLKALDMEPLQADQMSLFATEVLPGLLAADGTTDERRAAALALLEAWDGRMDRSSAAAAIAAAWLQHLNRLLLVDDLPKDVLDDYLGTDNLQQQHRRFLADTLAGRATKWCDDTRTADRESCPDLAGRALDAALDELDARLRGPMAGWSWGQLHTTRFPHQPLGEVAILGRFFNRRIANGGDAFTVDAAPVSADAPYDQVKAPGYRQIVTLREEDVGRYSIATGQSGHPLSGHYADRVRPHRDVAYAPLTLGRKNVTGSVLHLVPTDGGAGAGAASPPGAPNAAATSP